MCLALPRDSEPTHRGEEEKDHSEAVTHPTRGGGGGGAQGQPEVSTCPAELFINQASPGTELMTSTRLGRG